ncbi:MAG TPA: DoxX family protein [Thermoanaerobaculia bacterium]
MLFFLLLAILTLAAALASRLGVPGLADWPARMRLAMALALLFIGSDHLVTPERYLPMMPDFVPYPFGVVIFTGLCEIAGGLGLLTRRLRKPAAIALAVYFAAVFPANIKNAVEGTAVEGLPTAQWYYWVRLLFQPIAIWWALYAGGVIGPARQRVATATQPSGIG